MVFVKSGYFVPSKHPSHRLTPALVLFDVSILRARRFFVYSSFTSSATYRHGRRVILPPGYRATKWGSLSDGGKPGIQEKKNEIRFHVGCGLAVCGGRRGSNEQLHGVQYCDFGARFPPGESLGIV